MPTSIADKVTFAHPPHQTIAGCFALSAFAISIIAGLYAGNATDVILGRATACLLICYLLGSVLGRLCTHAVAEYLDKQTGSTELPDPNTLVDELVTDMVRERSQVESSDSTQAAEPDQVRQE